MLISGDRYFKNVLDVMYEIHGNRRVAKERPKEKREKILENTFARERERTRTEDFRTRQVRWSSPVENLLRIDQKEKLIITSSLPSRFAGYRHQFRSTN